VSAVPDGVGARLTAPRLVLFDLDGTLVDTVPDLAACVDATMADLGMPPRGESKVRCWVGDGIERLVKRALTDSQDGEPEAGIFDLALERFMGIYARHVSERSRPYPGAEPLLAFFEARKTPRVCVTNKAARYTEALLSDLGWLGRFDLVLSGDSLARKKPDPLPLLHAARHFGVSPGQCLMVGDSKNDVAAARAAGVPVVCVSYGYNHGEDIATAKPDLVIDSLDELLRLIA
jgi:phosphoglycolate phosphatase